MTQRDREVLSAMAWAVPYAVAVLPPIQSRRFEIESLSVQALSGETHSTIADRNLSAGAGSQLNATGKNQYVVYTVPVNDAGSYRVRVGVKTGAKSGISGRPHECVQQYAQARARGFVHGCFLRPENFLLQNCAILRNAMRLRLFRTRL
jgi:hypothetical protein